MKTINREYKYGFSTDIDSFKFNIGLCEETILQISKIKEEPPWLLDFRYL